MTDGNPVSAALRRRLLKPTQPQREKATVACQEGNEGPEIELHHFQAFLIIKLGAASQSFANSVMAFAQTNQKIAELRRLFRGHLTLGKRS